ncbi:MAG: bifunctional phosphoserine phosphatase/homoserine phosphotransferase ThrH [Rectinemataceae bacterium]
MRHRQDESPRGPLFAALDLEGVLIPEIWHALADAFGLPALMRTTREEADYGILMRQRLGSIEAAGLAWGDIAPVLARMEPLPGARAFLDRIRGRIPFAVVTDSFDLFVREAARGLDLDAVLCHRLVLGEGELMLGWEPRIPDSKRSAVRAFAALGYRVRAVGDSLNDIPMLEEAERGFLFRASEPAVAACGGRFGLLQSYEELERALLSER